MNKQILKGWTKTHLQWIGIVAMVCAGFLTSCVQSRTPQTLDRFTNAQQETLEGNELKVTAGTSWLADGDYKNFILKGEALTEPSAEALLRFHTDGKTGYDVIFHNGKVAETYNIGGFNEWKNIDIIKVVINTVDRLLGRKEGEDMDLITYVTDRLGHDMRYAIDSTKLQQELGWEPSLQFEEGIEKTVRWYLDNQEWMDNVTSGDYQKYYETMYGR